MPASLYLASALAGFAYAAIPGPAVLALFGIAANQGRAAGSAFLCGHLAGDLLWSTLALVAILGARDLGSVFFDLLGLLCGAYLLWLGSRAIGVRRRDDGSLETAVRRPLLRGVLFGLSNPKSYTVAVATFTALLAGYADSLTWVKLPLLLAAAALGFLSAYIVLIGVVGTGTVRRFYRRYDMWIVRASGMMFIGFGVHAIAQSWSGLLGRRA
jgi:threonine efflux protein